MATLQLTDVRSVFDASSHFGWIVWTWKVVLFASFQAGSVKDLPVFSILANVSESMILDDLWAKGNMLKHDRTVTELLNQAVPTLDRYDRSVGICRPWNISTHWRKRLLQPCRYCSGSLDTISYLWKLDE